MMTKPNSSLPPDLEAHVRAEPDAHELSQVWKLLDEAVPGPDDIDEDAWYRLRAVTLDHTRRADSRAATRAADRPARRTRRQRARWVGVPVAALLLALIGGFYLIRPVTVTAPAGAFATVALPDGSVVELNSGSALTYPNRFWKLPLVSSAERRVKLVGEGFFEVERGEQPFIVEAADAEVRVLGTAFNVRARGGATVVTVAEGRVEVGGRATAEGVVLGAGERARVEGGVPSLQTETVSAASAFAWRDQGFAVQAQPLAAIFEELERRYAVDIDLSTSAAASDTLTLYFPRPTDAEAILRDICTARELQFRRTSRGFEVY